MWYCPRCETPVEQGGIIITVHERCGTRMCTFYEHSPDCPRHPDDPAELTVDDLPPLGWLGAEAKR